MTELIPHETHAHVLAIAYVFSGHGLLAEMHGIETNIEPLLDKCMNLSLQQLQLLCVWPHTCSKAGAARLVLASYRSHSYPVQPPAPTQLLSAS